MNGLGPAAVARRLDRPGAYSRLAGFVVALAAGCALAWTGGPLGAAGGVALVAVWIVTTPQFAFAMGQVALVATYGRPDLLALVAVELVLLAVLVTPGHRSRTDRVAVAGTAVGGVALGGVAWWTRAASDDTLLTAAVVLACIGAAAYLLHRYELVALGRVRS